MADNVLRSAGAVPSVDFWWRSLNLFERADVQRAEPCLDGQQCVDVDRGRRRLNEWRSLPGFSADGMFARRLAQLDLTEHDFTILLGRTPLDGAFPGRDLPTWIKEIEETFFALTDPAELPLSEETRARPQSAFLEWLRPLLCRYVERLRAGIEELGTSFDSGPFDPNTVDQLLFSSLPQRLNVIMLRTLALEMQVAGLRGLLSGDTPEERFESYIEQLRRPEVAFDLFYEYPVLARQIVNCLSGWLETSLEFLRRWMTDWPTICETFSPQGNPGPLVAIEADAGDTHRGGRAVLIARCRSGLKVVYKPKSLAVDGHFQELLGWINAQGFSTPFRLLQMLDRGDYGWQEFVAPVGCASQYEVARFYRRQGAYVALLYVLSATDFHHENLIAAGEHPVLIDLEALFHPQEPLPENANADYVVGRAFDESILAAGLLPVRERAEAGADPLDVSGMGAEPGLKLPWKYPTWEGLGTDRMHLVRMHEVLDSAEHLPSCNGIAARVLDYLNDIEAGFGEMYELLRQHKSELLAEHGPIDRFSDDEVRVVLRATNRYGELLDEGFHPDLLRDAIDRDRHFDRLWEEVKHRAILGSLIPAELADLWNGDIPYFSTRPRSRDLWSSTGERFVDVHEEPGLQAVRKRIERLGDVDREQQRWFLRAALATLPDDDDQQRPSCQLVENGPPVNRERLLGIAKAVGDRLVKESLRGSHDANWIGISPAGEGTWALQPLGTDLYDGLPGVILFLAYLGEITAEDRYTELARAALVTLRRRVEPDKRLKTVTAIGGFSGWGGLLYTYAHLSTLWSDRELLAETDQFLDLLPHLISKDRELDLLSGSAGCIAGLLALHGARPRAKTLDTAVQCGEHLVSKAHSMPQGIAWPAPQPGTPSLAGFSHGAAGISWALARLATETGEERFRQAAAEGIAYERSLFVENAQNWPDLRPDDEGRSDTGESTPLCMTAWCHGAPGIGLARLGCLPHLNDPLLREEIDVAVKTTLAEGFGSNHCLCHGDLGNLELLLCATQHDPHSIWLAHFNRLAAGIVNSIDRDGWQLSSPLQVESPGLMTGYTGIGYAMLRLIEPERIPSILTLPRPAMRAPAERQI